MNLRRPTFRLTLPLSLLFIAGLACNVGPSPNAPDIGEAVRQTLEAMGPTSTPAPAIVAATIAPPTEPGPTATFTLAPPRRPRSSTSTSRPVQAGLTAS